jgi:hypothetical protein
MRNRSFKIILTQGKLSILNRLEHVLWQVAGGINIAFDRRRWWRPVAILEDTALDGSPKNARSRCLPTFIVAQAISLIVEKVFGALRGYD